MFSTNFKITAVNAIAMTVTILSVIIVLSFFLNTTALSVVAPIIGAFIGFLWSGGVNKQKQKEEKRQAQAQAQAETMKV